MGNVLNKLKERSTRWDDLDNSYGANNEYRIALLGRTGSGKSATGNNILGREAFKSEASGSSVTKKCRFETAMRFGKKSVIADTPGLFDTALSNDFVCKEITKCIGILAPGPHVFILVVQVGRFTPEEKNTVEYLSHLFGEEFFKYLIVLFTRRDDLENDGVTIHEYVKKVPNDLRSILKRCNNKYVAFDNTRRRQEKKHDSGVRELLKIVEDIRDRTGKSCYSNALFEKAELEFQKRAAEEKKQIEDREKEIQEREIQLKAEEAELAGKQRKLKERELENLKEEQRRLQEQKKNIRDNDRRKYVEEEGNVIEKIIMFGKLLWEKFFEFIEK